MKTQTQTQTANLWGRIRTRKVSEVQRIRYVPQRFTEKAKTVKCATLKQLMGDAFPDISAGIAARLVVYFKAPLYNDPETFEPLIARCVETFIQKTTITLTRDELRRGEIGSMIYRHIERFPKETFSEFFGVKF